MARPALLTVAYYVEVTARARMRVLLEFETIVRCLMFSLFRPLSPRGDVGTSASIGHFMSNAQHTVQFLGLLHRLRRVTFTCVVTYSEVLDKYRVPRGFCLEFCSESHLTFCVAAWCVIIIH